MAKILTIMLASPLRADEAVELDAPFGALFEADFNREHVRSASH
jgi:hypothetical protein